MKMSFGKFRDCDLDAVPLWYLRWIAQQEWLREPLLSAVRNILDGHYEEEKEAPARSKPVPIAVRQVASEIVENGYRHLSKKLHPDVGGNHEGMQNLNSARDWLRSCVDP